MSQCWTGENPVNNCIKTGKSLKIPAKKLFLIIRCIVSGMESGPPLDKLIEKIDDKLLSKRWKGFWNTLEERNG